MNKRIAILFADDDHDDRDLFCKAVEEVDKDIICHTVEDGLACLEFLRNPANVLPNYIFLDLRMPKMNGKKCLEEIRADDKLRNIPVIIYTSSDDVENSNELTRSGAVRFVTKPANSEEIYYLISMVLSEKWV